jgi:hypothetical protein
MDAKRIAGEFGRTLAMGTVAHSLQVEADVTKSHIYPYPVRMEPTFRPFDPGQTFEPAGQPSVAQAPRVEERITRRVILPLSDDVDWKTAEAMLAGLAGLHVPMSFELIAQHERASFYISAPAHAISFLTATALASYPESAIVHTTDPWLAINPTALVLYDLYVRTPYHRAIRASVSPWPQLLQLCTHLRGEEIVFCQILFAPVREAWQQNIAGMLEAERSLGHRAPQGRTATPKNLAEPLFAVAVRLGTTTTALAGSIEAITGIFTVDGEPFGYRTLDDFLRVLSFDEILRMLQQHATHTTGQLLTSSELARFVHLPDRVDDCPVELSVVQGLAVPLALRGPGAPLGQNFREELPVSVFHPLHPENKNRLVIGVSRSGKTSAELHRCRFLAHNAFGVGLLDPHRSLAFDLLHALADLDPARIVFLDFDAPTSVVAFNPFDHPDPDDYGRLASDHKEAFKHLFDAGSLHRTLHLLGMAIYGCLTLHANIATLPVLFAKTPEADRLRRTICAKAPSELVRQFFERDWLDFPRDAFGPLTNRLSALLLDDRTRRTFSITENRVNLARIMDEQQILIVAPPASYEAAGIVGGLIVGQALHAAFRRIGTPRAASHFHFAIDEAHRFVASQVALERILHETSKGGLSVGVLCQSTAQFPNSLVHALMSAGNIFAFNVTLQDARLLAPLFNGRVSPETLASQRVGEVHARIGQDLVNFRSPPPFAERHPEAAQRIIAHSHAKYYAAAPSAEPPTVNRRIIDTFEEE